MDNNTGTKVVFNNGKDIDDFIKEIQKNGQSGVFINPTNDYKVQATILGGIAALEWDCVIFKQNS